MERSIDLGSDLGEGMADDEAMLRLVTSAHISCGRHAGSAALTGRTIALARRYGVMVGAHPGYDDPATFGRTPLALSRVELVTMIRGQLEEFVQLAGGPALMVKPHGALHTQGERDDAVAAAIVEAVVTSGAARVLVATPGSAIAHAAAAAGLAVLLEGFADRAYESDGRLRSRLLPGALLQDPALAAAQAVSLAVRGGVTAHDGTFVPLAVGTLCVHGDTPGAPTIARAVRDALEAAGVAVRAFGT